MRGVLFFCHGARQASWREPFDAIVAQLRAQQPGLPVELAFLELMEPGLLDAVAALHRAGVSEVDVRPLFLAPGSHTRRDLPELIGQAQKQWPALRFRIGTTLTESARIREAIIEAALGAD